MNDDLHYGIRPIDLGKFEGRNKPSDIMAADRAYGWLLWTAYLVVCLVLALGWVVVAP